MVKQNITQTNKCSGGGGQLRNSINPSKNILYKNIKEINLTLVLILGVLFIAISGCTSYAIFSDVETSNNVIVAKVGKVSEEKEFTYTGACEEYEVKYNGYYKIEAWGAGSGAGALGGYTSGITKLKKDEVLYVCVGQQGYNKDSTTSATFNGGGASSATSSGSSGPTGAGATDIRLVNGSSWDDTTGLNSRIMVAGGAGGGFAPDAAGGGLYGLPGYSTSYTYYTMVGKAGSQTSGGATPEKDSDCAQTNGTAGGFGYGGTGGKSSASSSDTGGGGGGGGGYFGGSGGSGLCNGTFPGGGGSAFISGYAGVNAITSSSSRTLTYNTLHYSNKYFIDGKMQTGINSGNGKAKITYISANQPARTNKALDKVRYIKDCTNGSTANTSNHWVELQAIYNGENVAKGKIATGTGALTDASYITNGDLTSSSYAEIKSGTQCIIIDLGQEYDLDEIAVWHYYTDERTYNNNITYVSSDNETWNAVINKEEKETSEGKRVTAFESLLLTISSGENGSLSCTNNTTGITSSTSLTVNKGESITCTGTPNSWYQVSSLKIDDDSYTSGTAFTYNYDYNKTIKATFEKKDTTPPTTPVLTNSSNEEWTTGPVTITATSTDTESGVKTFQYSYDNSTWYNWNDGDLEDITDGKKGTGVWSAVRDATVYIRAIDNVGNISEPATTKVRIKEATLSCDCAYRSSYTVSTGGSWKCSAGHTHTTGYIHYCVCSDGNTYKYTDYATYPDGSYIVTYRWVCPTWNNYTAI